MTSATSDHKECIRCREHVPLSGFYAHPKMADGLLNACKVCVKASSRLWGQKNKTARQRITILHEALTPSTYMKRRKWNPKQTPPWYSELDELVWEEAHHLARLREVVTGVPHHVDHILPGKSPLVCGFHCVANWRVVPATVNRKKWRHLDYTL